MGKEIISVSVHGKIPKFKNCSEIYIAIRHVSSKWYGKAKRIFIIFTIDSKVYAIAYDSYSFNIHGAKYIKLMGNDETLTKAIGMILSDCKIQFRDSEKLRIIVQRYSARSYMDVKYKLLTDVERSTIDQIIDAIYAGKFKLYGKLYNSNVYVSPEAE